MTREVESIVPKVGEPDIDESYIRQQDVVLLETLLIDRTMTALNGGSPVNIKWAVDDYAQEYPDYPQLRWKATYGKHSIPFLHNKKGRTWRDYVKALRLEVACGEAPYLTSRYDTTTGKWIEPRSRIGLLDRKLRIVTEQCKKKGPEEWLKWAEVALHGCYGFEWQGDNVLLAREVICNAVFHRNYLEPSEVYVALYDDRLEITSPGGLVRDMTIEQAEHGYSKIRNDGLALALSYMKEVEGWGGGVARYFSDWTSAGLPRPKLEETPGFFKVVFDRKKKANEPLNEPVNEPVKMAVVQAIRKTPGIGRPALIRVVGKSRATMTRILSELVAQRIIEHRGSDKTGGYFLTTSIHKEAK